MKYMYSEMQPSMNAYIIIYYAVYSLFWAEILENRFGFYHCLERASLPCIMTGTEPVTTMLVLSL
jgi:hypothetical protein